MAAIDVSDLLIDPDFCDEATLIKRKSTVNEYGENTFSEIESPVTVVVQAAGKDALNYLPQGIKLVDTFDVWLHGSLGQLNSQSVGGACDVLLWNGETYNCVAIVEDFSNYGRGFTHALFSRRKPHG